MLVAEAKHRGRWSETRRFNVFLRSLHQKKTDRFYNFHSFVHGQNGPVKGLAACTSHESHGPATTLIVSCRVGAFVQVCKYYLDDDQGSARHFFDTSFFASSVAVSSPHSVAEGPFKRKHQFAHFFLSNNKVHKNIPRSRVAACRLYTSQSISGVFSMAIFWPLRVSCLGKVNRRCFSINSCEWLSDKSQ